MWKKNQVSCKHKGRLSFRCYYFLCVYSVVGCWMVDHYFLSSNWSEGHVQASKQVTLCPSPQHSVFTISNVVCDDKISAHGKTVNWILQCESRGSFIIVTLRTVTAAKVAGLSRLSLVFSNLTLFNIDIHSLFKHHPLVESNSTTCTLTPKNLWRHYSKHSF